MIAMGLSNEPQLLIADEPTTALDVTVQAQIIELLRDLNRELGTAIILITHNLAVVASLCTRIVVMYAGQIVEQGPTRQIFNSPQHPYTWSLLRSIPRLDAKEHNKLLAISGLPPDLANPPPGCKFHPRCKFRVDRCLHEEPPLEEVAPDQKARCWVLMRNALAQEAAKQ
jgi:peptide/nickel transport system ATP-binding protein